MKSNNKLYSIKMRASENKDGRDIHISGAEKIVEGRMLPEYINCLVQRGLNHSKGEADFINVKVEKINDDNLLYLDALSVETVEVDSPKQGKMEIMRLLKEIGVCNADGIMELLEETYSMRGAMLLDIHSLKRLEPDTGRGIRATYMDKERNMLTGMQDTKNHFEEALVLATKVANCPGIIGEICISDDPDYVTGYVASKKTGYRRITKMKEPGSENGGRIFLFEGAENDVEAAITFLEKQRVIVRNIKPLNTNKKDRWERIESVLDDMREKNLYRSMNTISSAQSSHVVINGREFVLMASNSYLDISAHPYVKKYCLEVLDEYGFGSGGSRLTTGNTEIHDRLEKRIAKFKECEAALAFNSGYVANVAIISAIMNNGGVIFSDELNHASIIDGCRLSKAKVVVYRHNDMEDLECKIRQNPCENGLVVSDAVFSMDGDILNLPEFLRVCNDYQLFSMVDEAHSTGVLGNTGHGIVEHFGLKEKPDILMGTLSKSVGAEGGYAAGPYRLIEYLKNTARGFIFSTSMSPVTVAAALAGFDIIEGEPERVEKLRENVKYFCRCLRECGIEQESDTPIIPIIMGDEEKAVEKSKYLYEKGFYIPAIRYPTVPKGQARLRVALMSSHTKKELRQAAEYIAKF